MGTQIEGVARVGIAANPLEAIKKEIGGLISARLGTLYHEASDLSADMEALIGRIQNKGHVAKVDDLRAGRWYRTASDLRLLQDLYTFVCRVSGLPEPPIELEIVDEDSSAHEIEDVVSEPHKLKG